MMRGWPSAALLRHPVVGLVCGRGTNTRAVAPVRDDRGQRAEGLGTVLNEDTYRLLVRSCGWTDLQYEQWLTRTIIRLVDTEQPASEGQR